MQAYRSGHNEAVLKTVWVKAHGGSNPSACAKNMGDGSTHSHILLNMKIAEEFEGGAVLREQNALPYGDWIMIKLKAKDDVDNVGAGRAAKGENPSACAKNMGIGLSIPIFCLHVKIADKFEVKNPSVRAILIPKFFTTLSGYPSFVFAKTMGLDIIGKQAVKIINVA